MDRLQEILSTMDVPKTRIEDWAWLGRNMAIRNRDHADFWEAVDLLSHFAEVVTPARPVVVVPEVAAPRRRWFAMSR